MSRSFVSIAFVSIITALLVTGCALPESEQLRKENTDLKAQLETVTQERDALKLQIDSIRKALEAPGTVQDPVTGEVLSKPPSSSTPDSTAPVTPDSGTVPPEVAPVNPGSSDSGVTPAAPEKMPETAVPEQSAPGQSAPEKVVPEQPVAPQSTAPVSPNPEMGGASVTTSPLYKYANDVVQAATNYRVQTQQAPPPDCSLGYSAGSNKVERSTQVKRCEVQALENNQFKVRLESIDGSVVMAP
jgi:hypothetical protein